MPKFRIEIDAIIVVAAEHPDEAITLAKTFVSNLDADPALDAIGYTLDEPLPRVQIIGEHSAPTVLTLSDPSDMDSIDGELNASEVNQLERGETPDSLRD